MKHYIISDNTHRYHTRMSSDPEIKSEPLEFQAMELTQP
jgi:hypothetical protein